MPATAASESVPRAVEIASRIELEKPSRKLLRDDLDAFEYVWLLVDHEKFFDAVRVLAYVLPRRESVWWACQCARQSPDPDITPEMEAALVAAEKWVSEMSEDARAATGPAAQAADLNTAAGCAAYAAFVTGGSMTPANAEPLTPPDNLTSQLVAGSILASALTPIPAQAPDKYRTFLEQGIELYKAVNQAD